jgi:hypothetical protein
MKRVILIATAACMLVFGVVHARSPFYDAPPGSLAGTSGGDIDMNGNDIDNVLTITDNSADPADAGWGRFGNNTTVLACERTPTGADLTLVCDVNNEWTFSTEVNTAGLVTTGTVTLPNGSAAAPSAVFAGDINSGPYSVNDGTYGISVDGTLRVYFQPSQFVSLVSINAQANILDSGGTLDLGGNCTTSHSLGTGSVCMPNHLEVNGTSWLDGLTDLSGGVRLPTQTAATPAAPATCDATTKGRLEVVDDNNDGAGTQICYCGMTDDAAYDWLNIADNTACTFY